MLDFEEIHVFASLQVTEMLLTLPNLFFETNRILSVLPRWSESFFSSSQILRDTNSLLNLSSVSLGSLPRQEQSYPHTEQDPMLQIGPCHSCRLVNNNGLNIDPLGPQVWPLHTRTLCHWYQQIAVSQQIRFKPWSSLTVYGITFSGYTRVVYGVKRPLLVKEYHPGVEASIHVEPQIVGDPYLWR